MQSNPYVAYVHPILNPDEAVSKLILVVSSRISALRTYGLFSLEGEHLIPFFYRPSLSGKSCTNEMPNKIQRRKEGSTRTPVSIIKSRMIYTGAKLSNQDNCFPTSSAQTA